MADTLDAEVERAYAEAVQAFRRETREFEAIARCAAIVRAHRAAMALAERGVVLKVTGGLARGHFGVGELVEFLVVEYPPALGPQIWHLVEEFTLGPGEGTGGFEALVTFLEDVPEERRQRALDNSVDATELRRLLASSLTEGPR